MPPLPDPADIRSALYSISPEDRDVWVMCGMAVKSALGEEGRSLWMEWSRQSERFKEPAARSVWRSFRGAGVGIGSLFHKARQMGWSPDSSKPAWKPDPAAERRRREEERRARELRDREAVRAAKVARAMLVKATWQPHPYLGSKGLGELARGVKREGLVSRDGKLLVPMNRLDFDARRLTASATKVMAVQTIDADGGKLFRPMGCATSGAAFVLGGRGLGAKVHWHCEGYATGLSVRLALDARSQTRQDVVVVGFSAYNMAKLARLCSETGGTHRVIADHDLPDRTGKRAGRKAAESTGLPWWQPPEEGTDANDYYQEHGLEALRLQLKEIR